jgi:dihydrofolate reductase
MKIFKKSMAVIMVLAILMSGIIIIPTMAVVSTGFGNARIISVNTTITGRLATPQDTNFYRVDLADPGKINVTFTHGNTENDNARWRIQVFNSEEIELLSFLSTGTQIRVVSKNLYLSSGTFYVRVQPERRWDEGNFRHMRNDAEYGLLVSFELNTGQFEVEPNDNFATANLIPGFDRVITGNLHMPSDTDYFKFILVDPGRVNLVFTHGNTENDNARWRIQVFDIEENELLSFISTGTQTRVTSRNIFLSGGTFFVRVQPERRWDDGNFRHMGNDADYGLLVSFR